MYHFLNMIAGARAGSNFSLDPTGPMRLGRGMDCDIVVTDPLCSRVHASVFMQEGQWWIRDEGSRNSTFVNGQKVDEAQLADGDHVRIGSTEFKFHSAEDPPTDALGETDKLTQTIISDRPMELASVDAEPLAALKNPQHAHDLLTLHQLSIKLLGASEPAEALTISLDLLKARTSAVVVGFLWVTDDGRLKPHLVLPAEQADRVELSESLTDMVLRKRHAVWVARHAAAPDDANLTHFADAMCIPLTRGPATVGAVHIYRERRRFSDADFDFAISLANILAVALIRARRQASLEAENRRLMESSGAFDEMIGESPPMTELKSKIARIARATGCVLVRGESGTGKELVAKALHKGSSRADRPLLSVNCAAIPATLLESQLFGHKKGAFTGADADHTGWFEQADTGTLFLDEVGEMSLEGQAKLLRILEGHPFLPVGGAKEITVDVRVICATNRDLREFVSDGNFREDLYYRLSVFELVIPPLRERGPDIGQLIDFFFDHFTRRHGRTKLTLSREARDKLLGYGWPGNVRQLRNAIDSAVVMAEDNEVEPDDLPLHDSAAGQKIESLKIDHWERKLIKEALSRTGGKVPDAAKLLGVSRATLYRKLDDYGIQR